MSKLRASVVKRFGQPSVPYQRLHDQILRNLAQKHDARYVTLSEILTKFELSNRRIADERERTVSQHVSGNENRSTVLEYGKVFASAREEAFQLLRIVPQSGGILTIYRPDHYWNAVKTRERIQRSDLLDSRMRNNLAELRAHMRSLKIKIPEKCARNDLPDLQLHEIMSLKKTMSRIQLQEAAERLVDAEHRLEVGSKPAVRVFKHRSGPSAGQILSRRDVRGYVAPRVEPLRAPRRTYLNEEEALIVHERHVADYLSRRLLLCGDVERNPGPWNPTAARAFAAADVPTRATETATSLVVFSAFAQLVTWLRALLQRAGDIEMNPGPPKPRRTKRPAAPASTPTNQAVVRQALDAYEDSYEYRRAPFEPRLHHGDRELELRFNRGRRQGKNIDPTPIDESQEQYTAGMTFSFVTPQSDESFAKVEVYPIEIFLFEPSLAYWTMDPCEESRRQVKLAMKLDRVESFGHFAAGAFRNISTVVAAIAPTPWSCAVAAAANVVARSRGRPRWDGVYTQELGRVRWLLERPYTVNTIKLEPAWKHLRTHADGTPLDSRPALHRQTDIKAESDDMVFIHDQIVVAPGIFPEVYPTIVRKIGYVDMTAVRGLMTYTNASREVLLDTFKRRLSAQMPAINPRPGRLDPFQDTVQFYALLLCHLEAKQKRALSLNH